MAEQRTIIGLLSDAAQPFCARHDTAAQAVLKHKSEGTLGQGELRADLLEQRLAADLAHELVGDSAVIEIEGELSCDDYLMCYLCGQISAEMLAKSIERASLEPGAKQLVLDVYCAGGDVGAVECIARAVASAKARMPVIVVARVLASAGYWALASANAIYGTRMGIYGSLGVFQVVRDWSGAAAREGVQVIVVGSGALKGAGTMGAPLSEPQIEDVRNRVVTLAGLMRDDILSGRSAAGLTEQLLDPLLDGRTAVGAQAQALRLIDGITTLDDLLAGRPAITAMADGSLSSTSADGAQEPPMTTNAPVSGAGAKPKAAAGDTQPSTDAAPPAGDKPGATTPPAPKAITLEDLQAMPGGPALIDQIKQQCSAPAAGSTEQKATLGELKATFAGDLEFAFGAAEKNLTITQAKAAYADTLQERLKAKDSTIADLNTKLGVATQAAGGSPPASTAPAAGGDGQVGDAKAKMDAAFGEARKSAKSTQAAISQIAASNPQLHQEAVKAGWKPKLAS